MESFAEVGERGGTQQDVDPRAHALVCGACPLAEQRAGLGRGLFGLGRLRPSVGETRLHLMQFDRGGVEVLDQLVERSVQFAKLGLGCVELLLCRAG